MSTSAKNPFVWNRHAQHSARGPNVSREGFKSICTNIPVLALEREKKIFWAREEN